MSYALLLHGKLGSWKQSASERDASSVKRNSSIAGQASFAHFAHASLWRHVVLAHRARGAQLSVVIHSWNPELASLLDGWYRPNASAHEASLPVDKVASQHYSIKRGMALLSGLAGPRPSLVMVARLDLLLFSDVLLPSLPASRLSLFLPHHCISNRVTMSRALVASDLRVRKHACTGGEDPKGSSSQNLLSQLVDHFHRLIRIPVHSPIPIALAIANAKLSP